MTDTWKDHDLYLSCIKVINSWPQEVWEQAAKAISEDIDKEIIKSCTVSNKEQKQNHITQKDPQKA